MRWKTSDVEAMLAPLCDKINKYPSGGDVDTTVLELKIKGTSERVLVTGFVDDGNIANTDDADISYVEVTDDSGDGLQTDNEKISILYGRVNSLLRRKGFSTVTCMKDYF